jgi:hypothetical protein
MDFPHVKWHTKLADTWGLCLYIFMYVFLHYFSYVTPKQINWFPETQKLKVNPENFFSFLAKIRSTVCSEYGNCTLILLYV